MLCILQNWKIQILFYTSQITTDKLQSCICDTQILFCELQIKNTSYNSQTMDQFVNYTFQAVKHKSKNTSYESKVTPLILRLILALMCHGEICTEVESCMDQSGNGGGASHHWRGHTERMGENHSRFSYLFIPSRIYPCQIEWLHYPHLSSHLHKYTLIGNICLRIIHLCKLKCNERHWESRPNNQHDA